MFPSSHVRRPLASSLVACGLLALLASASPRAGGPSLDNASFQHGLLGWQAETQEVLLGAGSTQAAVTVVDEFVALGSVTQAACLQFFATVDTPGGQSSLARVYLRRPGLVAGRYLEWTVLGGSGIESFGTLAAQFRAEVVVRGRGAAAGTEAVLVVMSQQFQGNQPLCSGVAVSYAIPEERARIDLLAAGFRRGDPVEIEVRWEGSATALGPCDRGSVGGAFFVDDFAFRETAGPPSR